MASRGPSGSGFLRQTHDSGPKTETYLVSALPSVSTATAGNLLSGLQPPVTANGLITGLNTQQIIQSLVAIDQAKVSHLQAQQQSATTQETAIKDIEAKLLALQNDLGPLSQPQNSAFNGLSVTSSNPNVLTAAASSSAAPGNYVVQVNGLAQAAQIASQGFAGPTSAITQGTLQIQVGSGSAATITIDNTNNTLQGLAGAINNANIGVTATVINDGSGNGAQPYRLLLTANQTGADNTINITNHLAADTGGAVNPVFGSTYIGTANPGPSYTGTSTPTANSGAGGYTGSANDTYTFTVVNGGTVGTDNGIQLSYRNSSGTSTGTITLNSGDAGAFKNVAQGIQVQLGAGTLVAGQTFSIKAYAPVVQQATNASITVGSGSGALTIQSATNQINGLINGVTLQLQGTAPNQPITLTVANDTSKAKTAIENFVSDYNALIQDIQQQTKFDTQTQTAGPLLGNPDVQGISQSLSSIIGGVVAGIHGAAGSLSGLGVTFNGQGQLQVDEFQLANALAGQGGLSLKDISTLFGLSGNSSNPGVQFIAATDKTQASGAPYQVNITQAATQASVQAGTALASSIVIDGSNDSLALSIDGHTGTVSLAHGTYTPQTLAQQLQTAIGSANGLTGAQVNVGLNGSNLTITSGTYGSGSKVLLSSGTALAALGFTGGQTATGKDVAGSFVVNGITEAATGTGQLLVGNSTNAHTSGLQVLVTLTSSQLTNGPAASLTVTRGIASQLATTLQSWLDPVSGRLKLITDGFDNSVQDLQKQIDQENAYVQSKTQALLTEFANMETTVSKLQLAGNYLSGITATLLSSQNASGSNNKVL